MRAVRAVLDKRGEAAAALCEAQILLMLSKLHICKTRSAIDLLWRAVAFL
jgi:hypothetical protein